MDRDSGHTGIISQQPPSSSSTAAQSSRASQSGWSGKEVPIGLSGIGSPTVGPGRTRHRKLRKISRLQTIYIASQLSVMVDTGIVLPEALESLAQHAEKPHVKVALLEICERVRGGSDLSLAVANCLYRFPPIFSALLRASEASGTMGLMLFRASEYLRAELDTIRKIRSALIYPAIMLVFSLLTAVLMVTFLLPRLGTIYKGHEDVLPLPTRAAFALSDFVLAYWIYIGIAVLLLSGGLIVYLCSAIGKIHTDWLKLNMPLLGRMFRKFYLTRSVRTMGTMIGSGRTVLDAVHLVRGISSNSYFSSLWKRAEDSLQAGAQLSDPLFASPLVPNTVAQMIATGEKTGRMAQVMERIAVFCESDLNNTIRNVITLIEPMMIIVMGTIIAAMAMAILLPIFSISKVLGG